MKLPPLVAAVTMMTLASCASLDPSVPSDEANLGLLPGTWKGTFERRARLRTLALETPVTLEIRDGKPMRGTFALATGTTWETGVEVREGKVLLGFDQAMREFKLSRGLGGSLQLEASYGTQLEGWPLSNRVVLEKK